MEYLKGGKRICDSPVWQLHNKNYKLGGTRLTNRSGDMRDPSLVSRRKNVLVKVKEKKRHKKEDEKKILFRVAKAWGRSTGREWGDVYK